MQFPSDEQDFKYIKEAEKEALKATCLRSKCGAVIVKDNEIIERKFSGSPYCTICSKMALDLEISN
jgi:deoxycytidylate deaminase